MISRHCHVDRIPHVHRTVDIDAVFALVAGTKHQHIVLGELSKKLRGGAGAVMPSIVFIHAVAYHQFLVVLLSVMLHVIQKVGCGIAYINDSLTIAVLVGLIGTEDELCIGSHTTQHVARKAVDTLDGRACGDVGAVHAMRLGAILNLQGVKNHFGVGNDARQQLYLCRSPGMVGLGDGHFLLWHLGVASQVDSLDAQIAILILEARVGIVEASVHDADNHILARIGLRQFFTLA